MSSLTLDGTRIWWWARWRCNRMVSLGLSGDGKILIGGSFSTVNGAMRQGIARLETDGTLDASFNPGFGANGPIRGMAVDQNGNVIVGGAFTQFDGSDRPGIARIHGGQTPAPPGIARGPSSQTALTGQRVVLSVEPLSFAPPHGGLHLHRPEFFQGTFRTEIPAVPDRTYTLETTADLRVGEWAVIDQVSTEEPMAVFIDSAPAGLQRFYRVRVE